MASCLFARKDAIFRKAVGAGYLLRSYGVYLIPLLCGEENPKHGDKTSNSRMRPNKIAQTSLQTCVSRKSDVKLVFMTWVNSSGV